MFPKLVIVYLARLASCTTLGMRKFLLSFPVTIVLFAVAAMSGILSIVREYITLYHPATPVKPVFWICVRVAFGISASLFAYTQWQRAEDLQQQLATALDNSQPKFACDFYQWFFAPTALDKAKTFVLLQLAIRNSGGNSIVDGWEFSLNMPNGTKYEGTRTFWQDPELKVGPNITLYRSDSFFEKEAEQPIVSGGKRAGWILFVIPAARDEAYLESAVMTLSFKDVNGDRHPFTQTVKGSGEKNNPLLMPGFKLPEGTKSGTK
jgi:hypothetical protein